jgi:hypothetical protein
LLKEVGNLPGVFDVYRDQNRRFATWLLDNEMIADFTLSGEESGEKSGEKKEEEPSKEVISTSASRKLGVKNKKNQVEKKQEKVKQEEHTHSINRALRLSKDKKKKILEKKKNLEKKTSEESAGKLSADNPSASLELTELREGLNHSGALELTDVSNHSLELTDVSNLFSDKSTFPEGVLRSPGLHRKQFLAWLLGVGYRAPGLLTGENPFWQGYGGYKAYSTLAVKISEIC